MGSGSLIIHEVAQRLYHLNEQGVITFSGPWSRRIAWFVNWSFLDKIRRQSSESRRWNGTNVDRKVITPCEE